MDFSFTEEQTLLRDSVQRFVRERYDFDTRRKILKSDAGWREDYWQEFADLGLLAVPFAEADGGLGWGPVETMIVMEEFGGAASSSSRISLPSFSPARSLRHAGSEAQRQEHIGGIVSGERRHAFAFAEPQSRYDLANVGLTAKRSGAGYVLDGTKIAVIGAPQAHQLIVSARTSGARMDAGGISLFLVDRRTKGVSSRDFQTVDGMRASEITFEKVAVGPEAVLGTADEALPLIERAADEAIAALCAEANGAMKALIDQTADYVKTRQQFGQPIGKFQVIQHRLVDMYVAYEQSVSITYMATLKLGEEPRERSRAVSAAKAHIGKAGKFIGQSAVQLYGGMGMTDELAVGHYFKRLTMIDTMFGNADHHLRRFAQLGLAESRVSPRPPEVLGPSARPAHPGGRWAIASVHFPNSLLSSKDAPWASRRPRTIGKPSPVPPCPWCTVSAKSSTRAWPKLSSTSGMSSLADADAGIGDRNRQAVLSEHGRALAGADGDAAAARREFDRVAEEVDEHLPQRALVHAA